MGYPIPQYRKKKWQKPKSRVENRPITDTAYFNHIYNRVPHTYGCFQVARLIISGIYAPDSMLLCFVLRIVSKGMRK